jgi:uncharacterized repeat protein (TIGR03803 family)
MSAGFALPASVGAFTLTELHSFAVSPLGAQPEAALVAGSGGLLYGTTSLGGTNGGAGTVFSISTNGALNSVYSFTGGADGSDVFSGLLPDTSGNFYGATPIGGTNDAGVIFKVNTNGVLTVLYTFGKLTNSFGYDLDGAGPEGDLIRGKDGALYGTTDFGGTYDDGTVFRLTTNGVLTTLYSFGVNTDAGTGTALDGSFPATGLIQASDNALYGTTTSGGTQDLNNGGDGTVFRVTTNGTFSSVYSFGTFVDGSGNNLDGANPLAALIQATNGLLYGTAASAGYGSSGTVFQITTNGSLTVIYTFSGAGGGTDGAAPEGRLLLLNDGYLYGTTTGGGTLGDGTVFKVVAAGPNVGNLTTLYNFSGPDGAAPQAGLTQAADGKLYGTTAFGGSNSAGTIFRITTDGSFASLFSFPQVDDGQNPSANLLLAKDGNFYGTTEAGGDFGGGTVFRMSPSGNLTLLHAFGSVTNSSGVDLDGVGSEGTLIQGTDGGLYGTTPSGGLNGDGTVYRITTNGAFTVLYTFASSDGATPWEGLVQTSNGAMYGTTTSGGGGDFGTIYRITTNGALTTIYSFSDTDGSAPYAKLALGRDGLLYGTTSSGGASEAGTVFKTDTNGSLSTIYTFSGGTDGADPQAGLWLGSDGAFYGTTAAGGTGFGTVFRVTTSGALTTLAQFNGLNGDTPLAAVLQTSDGSLYGTTSAGGTSGNGVVFQLTTNGALNYVSLDGITGSYPDSGVVLGPDGNLYTLAENGGFGGYGSIFRVNIVTLAPVFQHITKTGSTVLLTWTATATRSYQLQFKTNPVVGAWTNTGPVIVATNSIIQGTDTTGADPRRVYRVELLP